LGDDADVLTGLDVGLGGLEDGLLFLVVDDVAVSALLGLGRGGCLGGILSVSLVLPGLLFIIGELLPLSHGSGHECTARGLAIFLEFSALFTDEKIAT